MLLRKVPERLLKPEHVERTKESHPEARRPRSIRRPVRGRVACVGAGPRWCFEDALPHVSVVELRRRHGVGDGGRRRRLPGRQGVAHAWRQTSAASAGSLWASLSSVWPSPGGGRRRRRTSLTASESIVRTRQAATRLNRPFGRCDGRRIFAGSRTHQVRDDVELGNDAVATAAPATEPTATRAQDSRAQDRRCRERTRLLRPCGHRRLAPATRRVPRRGPRRTRFRAARRVRDVEARSTDARARSRAATSERDTGARLGCPDHRDSSSR